MLFDSGGAPSTIRLEKVFVKKRKMPSLLLLGKK
jgi:hypothetical protein